MTYQIEWKIPRHVVIVTYTDSITLEDLQGVNHDLQHFLQEGNAPVHVISYLKTNNMPTNLKAIRDLLTTLRLSGWGWFIVAGFDNALGRFLMSMVTNTFKLQAKAVENLDEAMEVIYRADIKLRSLV